MKIVYYSVICLIIALFVSIDSVDAAAGIVNGQFDSDNLYLLYDENAAPDHFLDVDDENVITPEYHYNESALLVPSGRFELAFQPYGGHNSDAEYGKLYLNTSSLCEVFIHLSTPNEINSWNVRLHEVNKTYNESIQASTIKQEPRGGTTDVKENGTDMYYCSFTLDKEMIDNYLILTIEVQLGISVQQRRHDIFIFTDGSSYVKVPLLRDSNEDGIPDKYEVEDLPDDNTGEDDDSDEDNDDSTPSDDDSDDDSNDKPDKQEETPGFDLSLLLWVILVIMVLIVVKQRRIL